MHSSWELMELTEPRSVPQAKIQEVFEEVSTSDKPVNIQELATLLFDEYNHITVWSAWKLVLEDVFFYGEPDKLNAYSQERVKKYLSDLKSAKVTHTHTLTHTHSLCLSLSSLSLTYTRMNMLVHTCTQKCPCAPHTHTHTHTHTHACTQIHTHTHSHKYTHTHTHTHTHTDRHTRAHAHKYIFTIMLSHDVSKAWQCTHTCTCHMSLVKFFVLCM
jgi:hypothetical protein